MRAFGLAVGLHVFSSCCRRRWTWSALLTRNIPFPWLVPVGLQIQTSPANHVTIFDSNNTNNDDTMLVAMTINMLHKGLLYLEMSG